MIVAIYICMKIYGDFFIIFFHFNCLFRLKTGYLERGQASRLVIDNVTYDYQGEYECRATNQINGQERTVASEPVSLQVVGECTFSSFFSRFLVLFCHNSKWEQSKHKWMIITSKCIRKITKYRRKNVRLKPTTYTLLTTKTTFNPTVTFQL